MKSVIFVCLGNICRSPIADGYAKKILQQNDIDIEVDSAGTGDWHVGEAPCSNSIKVAKNNGVDISSLISRQVTQADLDKFDLVVALDDSNFSDLKALGAKNLVKLGDYGYNGEDVPDPYFYKGFEGFEAVYNMIEVCVNNLFNINHTFLETIRAVDGEVFHLPYHQKRYESVLKSLGFNDFENLQEYIKPLETGTYRCRLTYNAHNIEVTYHEYKKREVKSLKLVYDDTIDYSKKSTSREIIDNLFEKKEECDDILIVKNSFVCDTSIANVAFYKDGVWSTPSKPLLAGTTRQRLLDEGKIIEAEIKVDDLKNYSKVALLNAMIDFDIISNMTFKN